MQPISPSMQQPVTTPLRTVNQCSACGALTMLSRCPNCDAPAVTAGSTSAAMNQQTPKTTTIVGGGGFNAGQGGGGRGAAGSYGTPVSTTLSFSPAGPAHSAPAVGVRQPVFVTAAAAQAINEPMFLSPTAQQAVHGSSYAPGSMATFIPAASSQPNSRSPSAGGYGARHQSPSVTFAPQHHAVGAVGAASSFGHSQHIAGAPVAVVRAGSPATGAARRSTSPAGQSAAASSGAAIYSGGGGAHQHPSDATVAQLRREVQRLSGELQKRTSEVEALHRDTTSGRAANRQELQELWQTVRRQSESLEVSKTIEEELRLLRQQHTTVCAERDHLRAELEKVATQGNASMSKQAYEVEEMRSALHRKQLETMDLEHAVEAAKRQAREAESVLQQHKVKVQQTTAEVMELQRHVEQTRHEDQQQIKHLKNEVATLEKDLLTAREDMARTTHEMQTLSRTAAEERRAHEREVSVLKRAAEEVSRLEALLNDTQTRFNATVEELRAARSDLRDARLAADAAMHDRVLDVERDYDAKLTAARRALAEAQAERKRSEMEAEAANRTVAEALEGQRAARKELDALKQRFEEADRLRATLLVDLENEARATADLRRQLDETRRSERFTSEAVTRATESSTDQERLVSTLRRDLADAQVRLRDLPERCAQLEQHLEGSRRKETELMMEVSRAKALADTAVTSAQIAADRRIDEFRDIERQRATDSQRTIDELRHELRMANEAAAKQTAVHASSIAELKSQFSTLTMERDSLIATLERMRVATGGFESPGRAGSHMEAQKQQLDAARREVEHVTAMHRETQSHCDVLRRDLAQARDRAELAQRASDDHRTFVRELREILAPWLSPAATISSGAQTADGRPIEHEIVEKARAIATIAEKSEQATRALQDKVDTAIASLDAKINDLTRQRDVARREAGDSAARIRELEDQLNTAITQTDSRIKEVYQELQAERDSLEKEIILTRKTLTKERDDKTKIVEEFRTQIRQACTERDTLHRELQIMSSDLEEARNAAADAMKSASLSKHDHQAQQAMVSHVEQQLRDAKKVAAQALEEKDRITQEMLAIRATATSDVTEANSRLEDLRVKHQRESESLKAMVRIEREKILKEIEATHMANARASDLELSNETLKAERERLSKELELARQFQASRVDAFHSNVEAVSKERDQLRRASEEALRKVDALEHNAASLRNDNATLELALREAAKERDNLARQLQHVQYERDGALRFMSLSTAGMQSQPAQQLTNTASRPVSPIRSQTTAAAAVGSHYDSSFMMQAAQHNQQHPMMVQGGEPSRAALLANFREERHIPMGGTAAMQHQSQHQQHQQHSTTRRVSPPRGMAPAHVPGLTPRSASLRSDAMPLSAFRR